MKAALLYENQQTLRIESVDTPKLEEGEALVQVDGTGLGRADLKFLHGLMKPKSYPHILGHEISGKIVDSKPAGVADEESLGSMERSSKKVLVYFYITCGKCFYCSIGRSNLCVNLKRPGFELPGGFCEYVKVPIQNLVPCDMEASSAVLADAGATMLRALRKVNPKAGTNIIVAGVGGLGTFGIQLAKEMDCKVIALDIEDHKLEFARELGADITLNISTTNQMQASEKLQLENIVKPIEIFIDLVGNEMTQSLAIGLLSKGGKLLQVGWSPGTFSQVTLKKLVYDELEILGSVASSRDDLRDIVELAELGKIKLNVTKKFRLEEINAAIKEFEENRINGRAVVIP
ncbi:MAG: zinc-binding dehydrogenase [Thaumarchaeota archaeon]|nr:zinc-binding dehydrogenase [Nitrososphaerota archaeon]